MPTGQAAEVHADPPPIVTNEGRDPEGGQSDLADDPPNGGAAGGDGDRQAAGNEGGKVFTVSQSAFKRIKEEAGAKGAKRALEDFVKSKGFSSMEELEEALARRNRRPNKRGRRGPSVSEELARSRAPGDGAGDDDNGGPDMRNIERTMRRMERRLERSDAEKERLRKEMSKFRSSGERLRREKDSLEAEMVIREAAARQGVRDVDYAMRLLTKKVQGLPEEDLAKFDEDKFFAGLRKSHSYLFGEVRQPATTGNGAGTAPPSPNPGAVQDGTAQGGQVDARKMSREDFIKHLHSRGLNLNA